MHMRDVGDQLPPVGSEGMFGVGGRGETAFTGRPLVEGMSLSLWLQTVRNNPLLDHRTTEQLPTDADVVIIGSGITGSVTALSLLQSANPPKSILMLEAREMCSGATGRNAGHCKPDQWRGFTKYEQLFGAEQALKKTWEALVAYVREHGVDCDLWVGKTFDVPMTDDIARTAAKTFADYKAAGGDVSKIEVTTDPEAAEKGARAVYAWDASTLHPWKLVAHVNKASLELGLNLQTWTPVTSITGSANEWVVHTNRGDVRTPIVIHATNAYSGALLPELKGPISPCPHMCNKVLPPSTFSGSKAIRNSYAIMYPSGLYTINSRPTSDGILLFGGSAPNQHKLIEHVEKDQARRTDDSLVNFEPVTEAVRKLGTEGFQWDRPAKGARGAAVKYDESWSGIIARARIFTAAPALAKMVQGATWAEAGLPECFEVTAERLKRYQADPVDYDD
ncbi:hypothetical protein IAU60_003152 [Kwoniella sp. DSM 27419]